MCLHLWSIGKLHRAFLFVCCSDQRFLGKCPHYLLGLGSVIENRCSPAFTLPTTSVCIKWKAGVSFLWDLAFLLSSLVLENFPKYWQGSGFVADQWTHILPWPPPHKFWGFEIDFYVVPLESYLPCHFNLISRLTSSELWFIDSPPLIFLCDQVILWNFSTWMAALPYF